MIMDGNGRWAKRQGKPRTFGHTYGAKALREIVRYADSIGIEALTAYAFSTENWKRPVTEVSFIMKLLVEYLTNELEEFKKYQVRMRFIGSRKELPDLVLKKMEEAEQETKDNQGILFNHRNQLRRTGGNPSRGNGDCPAGEGWYAAAG